MPACCVALPVPAAVTHWPSVRRISRLLDIVLRVESGPEPSVLEPVAPTHRLAIARVNDLCRHNADHFARELKHVSLADLERTATRGRTKRRGGPRGVSKHD